MNDHLSGEEKRAHGIASMGRVERDEHGFTVYSAGAVPEPFRVWWDEIVGDRCSCDRFNQAFRAGLDYRCEHILAVDLWSNYPDEERPEVVVDFSQPLRRVV